jgi:hypothetical protein
VADSDVTQEQRNWCITDHAYLANKVLGMESPVEHVALFDLFPHRQPNITSKDPYSDRLILWPRFSGKSTAVSVDVMQAILHNRDVSILYVTTDIDLAKRRLTQIADYFDHPTEAFRKTFLDFVGLERRTVFEFTVRGRKNRTSIDPTFTITTPLSESTGSHYDIIFIDDFVTFFNSRNEEQRNQTYERYRRLRMLRTQNTLVIITGTCYDVDDAYGRIQKAADSKWLIDKRSCWSYRCLKCGQKDLLHRKEGQPLMTGVCCDFVSDGIKRVLIDRFVTKAGNMLGYSVESLEHERSEAGVGLANFVLQFENDARPEATVTWRFTDDVLDKFYGRVRR